MKEQRKLLSYLLSVLVIASRSNSRNVFKIVAVKNFYTKKESSWMEYKGKERIVRRDSGNDRVFPIDSQSLEKFYNATLMKVEHATIHTGPYADELARSLHTLALVLGTDIFFRNGAYRPETEEGRKILSHELTHVTQQKRDILRGETTREELEREAEAAEKQVEDNGNPLITRRIGKKYYSFTQKEWNQINKNVKTMIEDWIESEERNMTEREYLDFLYKIQEMEIMEGNVWEK